jgi:hypothetical protein
MGLFAHYNRITGPGGSALADAISGSKSLQLLDLSFNLICGSDSREQDNQPRRARSMENVQLYGDYAEKWSLMF